MENHIKSFIAIPHYVWRRFKNTDEDLLGRSILTLLLVAETLICVFWIYTLSGLGEGYAFMAAVPYAYIVISYVSLLVFYRLQKFEYFIFIQLLMLLIMPFFMQWVIGGFAASSGVAIWAILSPVGALMILRSKQSTPWFSLFVGLVIVSWLFDERFATSTLPIPAYTKNMFFVINLWGVATIVYGVVRYFQSQKQRVLEALSFEQGRSDKLLLNILPASIALRLKQDDLLVADAYESVTILFADLVNFTELSAGMAPVDLLSLLNQVFSKFDELTERYGLEKIKTIGDAYMVVGGLPNKSEGHATAIASMALEMHESLAQVSAVVGIQLNMRIGINSGPVVAGVIGSSKFSYDLWGDSVNLASRMEHHAQTNSILVSEATYQLLKNQFNFSDCHEIEVKGKGVVKSYVLLAKL